MRFWKVLGLAGLAGVAATGVIITRNERRRAQLGPDEVRARLRQRYAAVAADGAVNAPPAAVTPRGPLRRRRRTRAGTGAA